MQYYNLIKDMSKYNLRFNMIQKAKQTNISEAARYYGTTRKTVRKWLKRVQGHGLVGLRDKSRAPKHIPHKMCECNEDRIVELRKEHPAWGSRRFKDLYGVPGSPGAIHRVIKQNRLLRIKKRRWRRRKNLSALKKNLKFFEKSQIDTKDLSDIYKYWPYMKQLKLPRYEYTLRELSTGLCFYAYAESNNSTYASLFARYVAEHLKSYGMKTARIIWQTDNGSEYAGKNNKKTNRLSAFTKTLKEYNIEHGRIPPRSPHLQADVETFHRLIEDELYDIEDYENQTQFLGKAYAYQLFFNNTRKNRYRDNKPPVDILRERFPTVDEGVLNLPPIRLESLLNTCYKNNVQGGYHVPVPAQNLSLDSCNILGFCYNIL